MVSTGRWFARYNATGDAIKADPDPRKATTAFSSSDKQQATMARLKAAGEDSRRRDRYSAALPSPFSRWFTGMERGGQQNDSLADG